MEKVICPNCGAAIYENEPRCPFCGYINITGAEEKFLRDVQQTETDMSQIPGQQKENLKKNLSKNGRIILITVLIAALVVGVVVGLHFALEALMYASDRDYDPKAEAIWQNKTFPMLDEMYAAGQYEELLYFQNDLYDINAKEGTNHSLYDWEHNNFIMAFSKYYYLGEHVEYLNEGKELTKFDVGSMIYYCLYFHYREYENEYEPYTEDELVLLEEYREFSEEVLYNRLKLTDDEIEEVYKEVTKGGYLSALDCDKYAKKIMDRVE